MKASRPCPFCRLAMPQQRCGFCGGSGLVEIHFATVWDWLKWQLCRRAPLLKLVLGPVRLASGTDVRPQSSPEGT